MDASRDYLAFKCSLCTAGYFQFPISNLFFDFGSSFIKSNSFGLRRNYCKVRTERIKIRAEHFHSI